jgi:glutathione reductase (NADPH)
MKDALDFDLVVVGGGSGGLAGAFRAAEHGARVALLEPGELGGTCVNVGCVPKKAMWLAAHLAERIELAQRLGFAVESQPPDWCELVAERQRYIANIHASYRRRLDEAGIVALPQRGRLLDARTVCAEDGLRLRAAHVLVATGARPRRPQVEGAEHGLVSDDFFRFTAAPARVAIVGGGYIGVELSGMLQALGSRVDLFVRGTGLLHGFDGELAGHLQENYRQAGVAMHFGYALHAVERNGERIRLRDRGGDVSDTFDALIFAIGRQPNSEGIGLAEAGVDTNASGRIVVDAKQDTSADGVHAVGDVTDRIELTPVAIAAARRLMDRLFGGQPDARLDYDNVPSVVFAHPPLGKVGLTEDEARLRFGDDEVAVYRSSFRPMLHALADVPVRSTFKLVCVGDERRVVGLHLLGDGAEEILQGFAVALKRGITLADLHDTVAIHPTSAEEIVLMR